jgi:tetratricopeptide (TPR) repeat protein
MLKTIKIALTSSSELEEDRREFEIFINRKNKTLAKQGIFLTLVIWEDFIDAMNQTRLQDAYNKAMQEVDIFVMLFFTKVGKYTLEEFESAFGHFKEHGKPFIYTYFKDAPIKPDSFNRKDANSLFDFKERLADLGHFTSKYPYIDSLKHQFNSQLDKLLDKQIAGKFIVTAPQSKQKIDIYHLPKPSTKLIGRTEELKKIEVAFNDHNTHIFAVIAAGGIGKSALIDEWLSQLKTNNSKLKTISQIFGWSFYSQGSHDTQTSSDQFFEEALPFWDYDLKKEPLTDDIAKGRRLAELLRSRPSLLVLDGVEPLQNQVVVDGGRLKDRGLCALLRDVERNGLGKNSLIVISSRQPLKELKNSPNCKTHDLLRLSTADGVELLKNLHVKGQQNEIETAVEAYGGHALALVLLGKLLVRLFKADVNQHIRLPELFKSTRTKEKKEVNHAERIMQFYSEYWAKDSPERCFLNLLGLFDRPMGRGEKDVLLEKAEIAKSLAALSDWEWQDMLANLQDMSLLLRKNEDTYDTHPLIRTYFGKKLQQENLKAFIEANSILYEYYKNLLAKERPDTLEEMEPLIAAVRHGCLAGKHNEAWKNVYWKRICWKDGKESEPFRLGRKLGAFSSELSVLSNFFKNGLEKPSDKLEEKLHPTAINFASVCLLTLGRAEESLKLKKIAFSLFKELNDNELASHLARGVAEVSLLIGDIKSAKYYIPDSISWANNDYLRMQGYAMWGKILHQNGLFKEAKDKFLEAERMSDGELRGFEHFRFSDLLLDQGEYERVKNTTVKLLSDGNTISPVNRGIDKLLFGRVFMFQGKFGEAEEWLQEAIEDLRKSGEQHHLSNGLLSRAAFYRGIEDYKKTWADLDEVKEIIGRSGFKLYQTDYLLESCRLIKKQLSKDDYEIIEDGQKLSLSKEEMEKKFKGDLEKATKLIKECGYHRRDKEVSQLMGENRKDN